MFAFIGNAITAIYELLCQGFNLVYMNKYKKILNELNSYSFNISNKDIIHQICIQVNNVIFMSLFKIYNYTSNLRVFIFSE